MGNLKDRLTEKEQEDLMNGMAVLGRDMIKEKERIKVLNDRKMLRMERDSINKERLKKKERFIITDEQPSRTIEEPKHYDNSNGSLYYFADDHKLNAWEFDIVKRIVRCRKKGNWKEDLEKTKFLIDLYIEEFEEKLGKEPS